MADPLSTLQNEQSFLAYRKSARERMLKPIEKALSVGCALADQGPEELKDPTQVLVEAARAPSPPVLPERLGDLRCDWSFYVPPFDAGFPSTPEVVGAPQVLEYAAADPSEGRIDVLAQTYAGDSTALTLAWDGVPTSRLRYVEADLRVRDVLVGPSAGSGGLKAVAKVFVQGFSKLAPWRVESSQLWHSFSTMELRLTAAARSGVKSHERTVYYHDVKNFGGGSVGLESIHLDEAVELSVALETVEPGETVKIRVTAVLAVAAGLDSHYQAFAGFAPYYSLGQPPGGLHVARVGVNYCP